MISQFPPLTHLDHIMIVVFIPRPTASLGMKQWHFYNAVTIETIIETRPMLAM